MLWFGDTLSIPQELGAVRHWCGAADSHSSCVQIKVQIKVQIEVQIEVQIGPVLFGHIGGIPLVIAYSIHAPCEAGELRPGLCHVSRRLRGRGAARRAGTGGTSYSTVMDRVLKSIEISDADLFWLA